MLAVLVAGGDTGLEPGAAAARAAMPPQTFRGVFGRLEAQGLVRRDGKRRVFATQAGIIEAGAGVPGVDLVPALDTAIRHFPTEAHRAFARLLLSGIVVRHLLHERHDDGWPGFIAVGGTGAGKTAVATFAATAFGLDAGRATRMLRRETPGSVFARRRQDRGAAWRIERSGLMDLPFLALDEWDKAPEQVRQEAGSLLLGSTRPDLEGERVEVWPLVMVMLNVQVGRLNDVLHEAFVRRSVVLYTTPLEGQLRDLDDAMHRLFQPGVIPRLQLDRLKVTTPALPEVERREMRAALLEALTAEGWRLCDVEGLSRLALGRAALLDDDDLHRAALATALDYLYTAATLDQVRPGFDGHLAAELGRGAMLPDAEASAAEAEERQQAIVRAGAAKVAADLEFEAERERRAATLVDARRAMGRRPADAEGKSIAKALTKAAAHVRGCRGLEALDAAWAAAGGWIARSQAWVTQRRQAQEAEDHRKKVEADARRRDKDRRANQVRQERAHRKTELSRWTKWRQSLAGMMPVEGAADLADKLGAAGVLEWIATPAPPGTGFLGKVRHSFKVGPGYWTYQGRRVDAYDAPGIWAEQCRMADQRVRQLGGRAAKLPAYRVRSATLRTLTASGAPARRRTTRRRT